MSDAVAAPAAPVPAGNQASNGDSVQKASEEILNTLPQEQSDEVEGEDSVEELPVEVVKEIAKLKKKLKVGGKEIEVDEDELVKRAQMGYSAEEKWQEAAQMRKQMENFVSLLQQDPGAALEKMGFNVDELAERRIQQRIEEMKKSPEQIEREKIEKELKALKEERQKEKDEAQSREIKQLQEKYAVELETEINSALDSNELGLPKSPYIIKRMADVMIYAMKNKVPNFTAKKALEVVQSEVLEELNNMYSASPDEVFEKLVGKDRLTKYRRGKVKKAKPVTSSDVKSTGSRELQQAKEDNTPKQKIKMKDFLKGLGSK